MTRVFARKESSWCSFLAKDEKGNTRRLVGTLTSEPRPGMAYEVEAKTLEVIRDDPRRLLEVNGIVFLMDKRAMRKNRQEGGGPVSRPL